MSTNRAVEPPSHPLARRAWPGGHWTTVVLVCGIMALIDGADAQSLSMAAPLIAKALAIPSAGVGLIFSIAALGGAVGYFGGGFLADRWNAKTVAIISAVVIGLFQIATAYVGDIPTLIAIRFIVGLALAAVVPGLVKILSHAAPARWRQRVQGLFWAGFPIGVLGSGIVNGWILTHSRWQIIFLAGGLAPLILAFALWALVPRSQERPAARPSGAADAPAPLGGALWTRVVLMGFIFFFTNGAIAIALNWTPSLLVRSGFAPATAASTLAWEAGGALMTMSVTGFIVERWKIWPVFASLVIATVAMVFYAYFIRSLPAVIVSLVFVGAFLALAGTASTILAGAILPGDNAATGIGLGLTIGRVGQIVFPGLVGLALQAGGTPGAALLLTATLPACGAVSALTLALLTRKSR